MTKPLTLSSQGCFYFSYVLCLSSTGITPPVTCYSHFDVVLFLVFSAFGFICISFCRILSSFILKMCPSPLILVFFFFKLYLFWIIYF